MMNKRIENGRSRANATFDPPYIVGAVNDVVQPGEEDAYFRVATQPGISDKDEIVISLGTCMSGKRNNVKRAEAGLLTCIDPAIQTLLPSTQMDGSSAMRSVRPL